MRKFTLLIASLFITIGAMAQTVVTAINTERSYTLECQSGYAHNTTRFIGVTDAGVINGNSSTAAYITFEAGEEDGSYYIKIGEKYLNHDGTTISASTTKSTTWILGTLNQLVTFKLPETTRYLNNNGTDTTDGTVTYLKANSHPNGPTTSNACSTWQMVEYNLESMVDVTYNYIFNGVQVSSATVTQEIGSNYAAPAIDYVTFTYPDGNITAENTTVDVTCTQNLPFTVSSSYNDATWYYMSIRNGSKWVARSESAPYANSTTKNTTDNGLWAFIGNVFDGIQVINKGAGEGYTLSVDDAPDTGSNIYMKEGNTAWVIEQGSGGFTLRQSAENNIYVHDYSSNLQVWNTSSAATDAGSALQVYDATDNTEAVAALQAAIDAANAMNEYIGTGLGKYTYTGEGTFAAAVAEYQAYVDGIESTNTPTPAEVEAKTTEFNSLVESSLTLNMPTAGSYIRIKSYATNQYLSSVNHTTNTTRAAFIADADASTILYFNGTSLVSYASGNYLVNNSRFLGYNGVQEAGATVEFNAANASLNLKGVYSIKLFGESRWLYAQPDGYTDAGSGNGSANYSYIVEEVATLPVTITAAKYATLYAPVALEIPEGVTAYTATIDGSYAILNEISGVIPAETGVVLAGEANTYDFTITTTTTSAESDLKGSAATTYNTDAGTYYALAIVNEVVGFYKDAFNNSRFQNNSHKAYLYIPTEQNSIACYSFSFDWGGTTGIENIEGATEVNAAKAIYDITGRQIKAITAPGIYIIDGKKTFVK